jgi:hypothetical protein
VRPEGERSRKVAAAAARVWSFRARAELDAAARFDRLAQALAVDAAPESLVALAARAAADERRHQRLCDGLSQRFAERAGALGTARMSHGAPPAPSLPEGERLVHEVVAMCCITETLSAALLGVMMDRASDDEVRHVIHDILSDEIDHGRIGWGYLAHARARGLGREIGSALPAMLAGTVDDELFSAGRDLADELDLGGLGALGRGDRLTIFRDCMLQVVLPGLERWNVDTQAARAWLARHGA